MPSSRNTPGPSDRQAAAESGSAPPDDLAPTAEAPLDPPTASDGVDISALSIAGITRRRVGWVAGGLVSAWIGIIFARQAGERATPAGRGDKRVDGNRAL